MPRLLARAPKSNPPDAALVAGAELPVFVGDVRSGDPEPVPPEGRSNPPDAGVMLRLPA